MKIVCNKCEYENCIDITDRHIFKDKQEIMCVKCREMFSLFEEEDIKFKAVISTIFTILVFDIFITSFLYSPVAVVLFYIISSKFMYRYYLLLIYNFTIKEKGKERKVNFLKIADWVIIIMLISIVILITHTVFTLNEVIFNDPF